MQEQRDSFLPDLNLITDQDVFCFKLTKDDLPDGSRADECLAEPSAVIIPFRRRSDAVSPAATEARR
jgi:hypothetical protein